MTQETFNFDNSRDSQNRLILAAFKQGKRLTPLFALKEYGCLRLGARCWDLRHGKFDGVEYPIKRDMVDVGNGKRVAEYRMDEEQNSSMVSG